MMSLQIELYEALTQQAPVTPEKARAVVKALEEAIDDRYGAHSKVLVTQGDLKATEAALKAEVANVKVEIANAKSDILRWVIAIQLTSTVAIIGTLVTVAAKLAGQ